MGVRLRKQITEGLYIVSTHVREVGARSAKAAFREWLEQCGIPLILSPDRVSRILTFLFEVRTVLEQNGHEVTDEMVAQVITETGNWQYSRLIRRECSTSSRTGCGSYKKRKSGIGFAGAI
jgi:hypothetical protein